MLAAALAAANAAAVAAALSDDDASAATVGCAVRSAVLQVGHRTEGADGGNRALEQVGDFGSAVKLYMGRPEWLGIVRCPE